MTGRFKMKIAIKLSENFGFLPILWTCRYFTIVISRYHSLWWVIYFVVSDYFAHNLSNPFEFILHTAARMVILKFEFNSVTMLKKTLIGVSVKICNLRAGPTSIGPACSVSPTSSLDLHSPLFSHCTPDSQFLKRTRATHPLLSLPGRLFSISPPGHPHSYPHPDSWSQSKHQFLRERLPWPPINCAQIPSYIFFGVLKTVANYIQFCEAP